MIDRKNGCHNYVKRGKFKNVNCPYALVRGVVFPSIYSAEEFCTTRDLDANTEIESDNPLVLAKCKQIAEYTLPTLRTIQENYQAYYDSEVAEADKKVERRNTARACGLWELELLEGYVASAIGEISGIGSCIKMLSSYIQTLEKILRL